MGVEKTATAEAESKSAFAKRLGVSPSYITKLVGKGLPLTVDGRHVKVADALAWVRANINTRADEGRSAARPPVDLNDARIRLTLAQADIAEQNARKARRETVDREEARRAVRAFGRALRDLMLNFANRYGGSMAAELKADPATLIGLLDARMREMLLEGLAVPAPYHKPTEPVMVDGITRAIRAILDPASELRQRFASLVEGFSRLYENARPVIDYIGGPAVAALALLALYVSGPLLSSIGLLSLGLGHLAKAIMATPFGWFLASVAAVAASAYVLWQRWDEFLAYWIGLWGRVTAAFDEGFMQGVAALLLEFNPVVHIARGIDAVFEYFTGISLLEVGRELLLSLDRGISSVIGSCVDTVSGLVGDLVDMLMAKVSAWYDAGRAFVVGIWEGIKAGWSALSDWVSGAVDGLVAKITGWMPDYLKEKLGFSVEVAPTVSSAGPAAAGIIPAAPALHAIPPPPGAGFDVEAGTMSAQSLVIPEPLVVREPQAIDASVHIGTLSVEGGGGTPAEVQAAVRAALARHASEQRAALQSGLTD